MLFTSILQMEALRRIQQKKKEERKLVAQADAQVVNQKQVTCLITPHSAQEQMPTTKKCICASIHLDAIKHTFLSNNHHLASVGETEARGSAKPSTPHHGKLYLHFYPHAFVAEGSNCAPADSTPST